MYMTSPPPPEQLETNLIWEFFLSRAALSLYLGRTNFDGVSAFFGFNFAYLLLNHLKTFLVDLKKLIKTQVGGFNMILSLCN